MTSHRKTNIVLGFITGILAKVSGTKPAKPSAENLKEAEFGASTQRLGIRFTERIRDVFRFKWLKKS